MESTLFGHEKGAFTGADTAQKGCCEAANGGTLFLDEIGELDISLQSKLLRFLQELTVQRVGSSKVTKVDVRIVAATNRHPEEQVRQGLLREDLYYRLMVVPIKLPPLRDRRDDIPQLAIHFLQRAASRMKRELTGFSPDALDAMCRYNWPGNVRQLENLVERLAILGNGPEIAYEEIPPEIRAGTGVHPPSSHDLHGVPSAGIQVEQGLASASPAPIASNHSPSNGNSSAEPATGNGDSDELRTMDQIEKQAIINALKQTSGNVSNAARVLGLGQATVYRKIKRYGITPKDYVHFSA